MSGAPMADRDLARVLAEHAPATAPAGLRARIAVEVEATPQQRRVPRAVAPLFDSDPVARHRTLLLAAALLLMALVVGAAVAGALLEQRQQRLGVDPVKDPAGYLVESYLRFASLPAFAMTTHEQEGPVRQFFSDGHGRLRIEDEGGGTTRIVTPERVLLLSTDQAGSPVAVDLGMSDALAGQLLALDAGLLPFCDSDVGGPGCLTMACDPPAAYLGQGEALGRPVHRVACGVGEYWVDVATRLPLRHLTIPPVDPQPPEPAVSGVSPAPIPVATAWDVLELHLGPQPAALFTPETPAGYRVILGTDPACAEVVNAECREMAGPSIGPIATPVPIALAQGDVPDADELAARVIDRYAALPPMHVAVDDWSQIGGSDHPAAAPRRDEYWHDGRGSYRLRLGDDAGTVYIATGGHIWHRSSSDGRTVWRDMFGPYADHDPATNIRLGFPTPCPVGWRFEGTALVRGRDADRIDCGNAAFWIDRAEHLIVRVEIAPNDPLDRTTRYTEAVALDVGEQSPDLFRLPAGAEIEPRPSSAP